MDVRTVGFGIIAVVLVASAVAAVAKRMLVSRVEALFGAGELDACLKTIESPIAKWAIPKFNRQYLRLNVLEARQDTDAVAATLDEMLRMRCTPQQRHVLLVRAFSFYAGQEDREHAAHVLELIESNGDKELLKESRRTFGIVFDKKFSYIREMEQRLGDTKGEERAQLLYLLALQYENKGDKRRAEEYLQRVASEYGLPSDKG